MRLTVLGSAFRHGITEDEIRSVIAYPLWTALVTPRIPKSRPRLFIGRLGNHEPPIEVLADTAARQRR